jgi:CHAD domain-containing protein
LDAKQEERVKLSGNGLARLAKGLKKQWKCYEKCFSRCQKKLSEEAIHELRVQTRRLLATFELLGDFLTASRVKKIECALKENLDEFDDLRDTQVGLKLAAKLKGRFSFAREFYKYLLEREKRYARRAHNRIRKVKLGRIDRLVRECRRQVEQQRKACLQQRGNRALLRAIARAFGRVKRFRTAVDARDTKTIHRTRVAFKEFRYMVEAMAGCLPDITETRLEAMHDYQTLMGDVQDAQVLLTTVDKYVCKHEIEPKAALGFRNELLRRRQILIERYLAAGNQLGAFWPS